MESKRIGEEIEILLGTQTTREKSLAKKFRSNDAVKVINFKFLPLWLICIGILRLSNTREMPEFKMRETTLWEDN